MTFGLGYPLNFEDFVRVYALHFEKWEFLPPPLSGGRQGPLRGRGASLVGRHRFAAIFPKFWAEPITKSSKFRGTPYPKVKKCEFFIVKEATRWTPNP